MLFSSKKNKRLRLYMNYRELNKIIIKNHYFLLLIDEMLNQLVKIKIYLKINLCDAYYRIKIWESDK